MRIIFLKLSTVILLLTFIGAGCQKEKIDYDPDSIIGKWEWIYSLGGFAGTTYPKENESVTWEFTEDSMFIRRINKEITFKADFHASGDTLFWNNDTKDKMYQFQIKGDTLNLIDLSFKPLSHIYKRIK